MIWLTLIAGLGVTMLTAVPLGAALGLIGLFLLHFFAGGITSLSVPSVWNILTDFTLGAVPLYIFLGELLIASGISDRVYSSLAPLFRRIPGRLLHTNIAVCTVFGAVSGSSTSTAAAVGSVAYPELVKRGYARAAVVGSLAGGGTLGLLIPPSLSLLIYGATQGVSISSLFLAGILPGLLFAMLFMVYIAITSLRRPEIAPSDSMKTSVVNILLGLLDLWPIVVVMFSVLGTIYLGIATPTEAAALGVGSTIVIGVLLGRLNLTRIWQAFYRAVHLFAAIAFVLVGTLILAQAFSIMGIPHRLTTTLVGMGLSKYEVLFGIVVIYLVLGCFFDGLSLMIMTLPLVFPIMTSFGFDPVWLGVFITILIEIGMITPPIGINLLVLMPIARQEVPLVKAAVEAVPYWLILLFGVGIVTIFPGIVLFLPEIAR